MPTSKKPAAKSAARKTRQSVVTRAAKKLPSRAGASPAKKPVSGVKTAGKTQAKTRLKTKVKAGSKPATKTVPNKPAAKRAAKPAASLGIKAPAKPLKLPRPAIRPSINVFATPFPGNPFLAPVATKIIAPLPPPPAIAGEDKRFCSSCQTRKPIQKGSYKTSRDGRHRRWICVDCLAKKISR